MDTTNILFVCGGAFVGLEKIVERRLGKRSVGFMRSDETSTLHEYRDQLLGQTQPQDLIKYGIIPEFVGRVPVIGVLEELDREALIRILTEPRNAIVRQYIKMFEYEGVTLDFSKDALEVVADMAIERKLGARGLRMIMEELMLDLMYELPSAENVGQVTITGDAVQNKEVMCQLLRKAS